MNSCGFRPWYKPSHLWLKALDEKCVGVFLNPLPSNAFEEIFYCAKYLRAILLITYLSLYWYICTNSTLTNMNELIHEEMRVMCYIPHQKSQVLPLFFFFLEQCYVFQAHFCGTRDLLNGMKHKSLRISVKEKFSALSQRLGLISVSTNGSLFWLSVCDTAKHIIQLQNNCIHQNTLIQSSWGHLLYCFTHLN